MTQRPRGRPQTLTIEILPNLTEWVEQRKTQKEILRLLLDEFGITCSRPTLARRIRQWGLQRRSQNHPSSYLCERIQTLFFEQALQEADLYRTLQREGFQITRRKLQQIRLDMGLIRRLSPEQNEIARNRAKEIFAEQESNNSVLQGYGSQYLYTWFRQQQHIISYHSLKSVYREVYPEIVRARLNDVRYRRNGWTCAGPNFIWSVDAYDKLQPYGIEIYACIDAYSRYIVWFYAGDSAHTQRSIFEQYLTTVHKRRICPSIIRSDHGVELNLTAGAHWFLSQTRANLDSNGTEENISFRDCWLWGKSIHNVKIERWWNHLCQARSWFWRKYFNWLASQTYFNRSDEVDRIALKFIFMPIIREEFTKFVQLWNNHYIRSQRSRPHVVPGQPWVLYHSFDQNSAKDFGFVPHQDRLDLLKEVSDADPYDLDAYLLPEVEAICKDLTKDVNIWEILDHEKKIPYFTAYRTLQQKLRAYKKDHNISVLGELERPTNGLERIKSKLAEKEINVDQVQDQDADDLDPSLAVELDEVV